MPSSTVTLQNVVNLASTHVDLVPLAGVAGFNEEPALSICNDILAELLASPLDWPFNRADMPLIVTTPQKQDYLFAGATAFTLGSDSKSAQIGLSSSSAISESGTTVTVTTLEAHPFKVGDTVFMTGNVLAAYNSTFTQTATSSTWSGGWVVLTVPTTTTFTFTHATSGLAVSGAPGIKDLGWLASASMVEMNSTSSPQQTFILEAVKLLQPTSRVANPQKVCVIRDFGTGVLKIRFQYCPGSTIWGVNMVYQAAPPNKTTLGDTWAPVTDPYLYVIRQAWVWAAYRYLGSPKAEPEYVKLQQKIMKALDQGDREMSDIHIYPEQGLLMDTSLFEGW